MKIGGNITKGISDALKNRHEPEEIHRLADLYWGALLAGAFIVLILVFLYSTWVLLRVLSSLGAAADTSRPPPSALSRSVLNATVGKFIARQAEFDSLKTSPPQTIPDPSR